MISPRRAGIACTALPALGLLAVTIAHFSNFRFSGFVPAPCGYMLP